MAAAATPVSLLLLGDSVGKSTLLSRLSLGPNASSNTELPTLRDDEQPFIFKISRPHVINNGTRVNGPDVIVLCYAIPFRESLENVCTKWKHMVETHFNHDEAIPVMLLGLQRDQRTEEREAFDPAGNAVTARCRQMGASAAQPQSRYKCVMPQEGLRLAQEMRCDRYAECSSLTGELCSEVFEDMAQLAFDVAKGRGRREGNVCLLM